MIGVALYHHESLMTYLNHCAFTLYDFKQSGPMLVRGDLPVVSIPPQGPPDDGTAPRVMLPLSSDLLLVAVEGAGDEVREGHVALAGYANAYALYMACREVYSRRRDFPVMLLSSETVDLTIEDAISGRGPDVVAHPGRSCRS
ncbi:MAG: hypothetical protein WBI63_09130 [Coriobacteriia bacterium]